MTSVAVAVPQSASDRFRLCPKAASLNVFRETGTHELILGLIGRLRTIVANPREALWAGTAGHIMQRHDSHGRLTSRYTRPTDTLRHPSLINVERRRVQHRCCADSAQRQPGRRLRSRSHGYVDEARRP